MFKNRFLVVIGVISLLLATLAVSSPRSGTSPVPDQGASDFYQRHPDWTWAVKGPNIGVVNDCFYVPVRVMACANQSQEPIAKFDNTSLESAAAFPDYFQRHPEVSAPVEGSIDTTDYFFRHSTNTSSLPVSFSAEQISREYILGERYGTTAESAYLEEYWLGERYGQRP